MLKSFKELEVWQKAHSLVLDVYRVTNLFPRNEQFGVTSQLRRAASSIPANIAEGFGRRTTRELLQCIAIANGSLEEARYFLLLSRDLRYLPPTEFQKLDRDATSVAQMLAALSRSLKLRSQAVGSAKEGLRITGHGSRGTGASS
jgi:four helix bundle protein